jgi:predicted small lipoprotein YifL
MKKLMFFLIVLLFVFGMAACKSGGQMKDPDVIAKEAACNEAYQKCKDDSKGDKAALLLCDQAKEECIKKANKK